MTQQQDYSDSYHVINCECVPLPLLQTGEEPILEHW